MITSLLAGICPAGLEISWILNLDEVQAWKGKWVQIFKKIGFFWNYGRSERIYFNAYFTKAFVGEVLAHWRALVGPGSLSAFSGVTVDKDKASIWDF